MPCRTLTQAVERNVQPDILVDEQVKVGMEIDGVAAMPDDVQPVPVLMVETERHSGQRRIGIGLRCIHLPAERGVE